MGMQEIVLDTLPFAHEQAKRHGEGLFTGAPNPEIAFTSFVHFDEALFKNTGFHHQSMDRA
jgi:hypothetical protein